MRWALVFTALVVTIQCRPTTPTPAPVPVPTTTAPSTPDASDLPPDAATETPIDAGSITADAGDPAPDATAPHACNAKERFGTEKRAVRTLRARLPRIVNGLPVPKGKHPGAVSIQTPDRFAYCGGSAIGTRLVLTAAHCEVEPGDFVVTECVDLRGADCKVFTVERVLYSPTFNGGSMQDDWSLLRLNKPHGLNKAATLAGRDFHEPTKDSVDLATVVGFGRTSENGPVSPILLETRLPLLTRATCNEKMYSANAVILPSQLCALEKTSASCQGDSGGPLYVMVGNSERVAAMTSWGIGCMNQDYPIGVYAFEPFLHDDIVACATVLSEELY